MSEGLLYTSAARRAAKKLDPTLVARLEAAVVRYVETGLGDVRAMKGRPGWRLRDGDWRVIFDREARPVVVFAVGHRRDIYDR